MPCVFVKNLSRCFDYIYVFLLQTIKGERKAFYPPSEGYRKIIARPKNQMVLDWVYGCRGCDVNRNLWILKSGELVYFVSTTVVIYNRVKETQRHYRGHTEEITCMDINSSKNLGLSGQRNGKTHDSRLVKVHIIWEGHKFLRNLHRKFERYYIGQIYGGDFAKICGILRIYELYI